MDSISENVVAMIAVVVGILIIGTALVPIVQHASQNGETETVSGSNTALDWSSYIAFVKGDHVLELDGGAATLDGDPISSIDLLNNYSSLDMYGGNICNVTPDHITVNDNGNVYLSEGTVSITPAQATIAGTEEGTNTSYTGTFALTNAVLSAQDSGTLSAIPDVYGYMEDCTIGDGQTLYLEYFSDSNYSDGVSVPITTSTESVSYEGATLTKNSNGTVTVTLLDGDYYAQILGPIEWSQTITTGGTSQYAALYGIIPIMCILAMAYVLIRRF